MAGKPCTDWSPILTHDFLYNAYCVEKKTIVAIAREVGCRTTTVTEHLQEYGLFQRITKEWIFEQYVTQQRTVDDIAQELHCAESHVRYFLRRFDISIRYKSRGSIRIPVLNDREWLYEQYITNHLSLCQIADMLACAESSVHSAIAKFNIPFRPMKVATGTKVKTYYRRGFSYSKSRRILRRDEYCCQWPGCNITSDLEVHHIIPVRHRGTNSLDNGITLCSVCHTAIFGKEDEYVYLFQTIIASRKTGANHLVSTATQLRFLP